MTCTMTENQGGLFWMTGDERPKYLANIVIILWRTDKGGTGDTGYFCLLHVFDQGIKLISPKEMKGLYNCTFAASFCELVETFHGMLNFVHSLLLKSPGYDSGRK